MNEPCLRCQETGLYENDLCERCRGSGEVIWVDNICHQEDEEFLMRYSLSTPKGAYWSRIEVKLSHQAKKLAEDIICRDSYWAYRLRKDCKDLPPEAKQLAEEVACRDPEWAYYLRLNCKDLSPEVKKPVEEAACRDPERAYFTKGVFKRKKRR